MNDLLSPITVGEPDVAGALCVFPTFGPEPRLEYVSLAEGAARGVAVTELPGGASVNDLLVVNPLDVAVLLYEGEEVRGAQQDRTIDGAVLVPAGVKLTVPVSCVERGRWDHTRHAEPFAPSPDLAFPSLRAAKSARMREALAAAAPARADQGEVWGIVGAGAMAEEYAAHDVGSLAAAITRRDGQTGAIVAIGGRIRAFDHVSRPDAWAALHGPLVRGYALDTLRDTLAPGGPAPGVDAARDWLAAAAAATVGHAPAVGAGTRVHFASPAAAGTGLVLDGELIQLSAYAESG